jgi:hypothetical protein
MQAHNLLLQRAYLRGKEEAVFQEDQKRAEVCFSIVDCNPMCLMTISVAESHVVFVSYN